MIKFMRAPCMPASLQPPIRATAGAAGFDLSWEPSPDCSDKTNVFPGEMACLTTGWHVEIPPGYVGLIRDRSGSAMRGLTTRAGVIDSDYRGEIKVVVTNDGNDPVLVAKGCRIAQMVVVPCLMEDAAIVDVLGVTDRDQKGFGSTG